MTLNLHKYKKKKNEKIQVIEVSELGKKEIRSVSFKTFLHHRLSSQNEQVLFPEINMNLSRDIPLGGGR